MCRRGVEGGGGKKLEETRVGVTRHREHVALAVENGSHVPDREYASFRSGGRRVY